jgi:phage-related protein
MDTALHSFRVMVLKLIYTVLDSRYGHGFTQVYSQGMDTAVHRFRVKVWTRLYTCLESRYGHGFAQV